MENIFYCLNIQECTFQTIILFQNKEFHHYKILFLMEIENQI